MHIVQEKNKENKKERKGGAMMVRNFVFGVEDSLVSTVGLLSGVAIAGTDKATIIVAGVILIFVEAFSMGVGSVISEKSTEEFEARKKVPLRPAVLAGLVMFLSYLLAGLVPLAPYFFLAPKSAFPLSIAVSLLALFFLGMGSGRMSRTPVARQGVFFLLLGGIAIAVGVVVGTVMK